VNKILPYAIKSLFIPTYSDKIIFWIAWNGISHNAGESLRVYIRRKAISRTRVQQTTTNADEDMVGI
jgi:hypothetical protein